MGKSLAELNVIIGAKIKNFDDAMNKVQRKLDKFQRKVERSGQSLTQNLSLPIFALGAGAIAAAGDMEMLTNSMTSIMGDAKAAAKEISLLQKEAMKPGLGFEQAIRGSVKLQSVGFSAEEARRSLAAFGNALSLAGGSSADLDGVSLALTQIVSKGKVMAQEINQLAERVPQIRTAMQDAFGTADTEVLQKMGIEAKDFVAAVTQSLEQLPGAVGGINNAFENLRNNGKRNLAELGQEIDRVFDIKSIVDEIGKQFDAAISWFKALDDQSKENAIKMAAFAAAIGPALLVVGKLVGLISSAVGVMRMLVSPVSLVIGVIAGLATAAAYVWQNWEAFQSRFQNMWTKIGNTVKLKLAEILGRFNDFQKWLGVDLFDFQGMIDTKLSANDLVDEPSFKTLGQSLKDTAKDLAELAGIKMPTFKIEAETDSSTTTTTAGANKPTGGGYKGGAAVPSVYKKLVELFEEIDQKAAVLGKTFDAVTPKLNAAEKALIEMVEAGTTSGSSFDLVKGKYDELVSYMENREINIKPLQRTWTTLSGQVKSSFNLIKSTVADTDAVVKSKMDSLSATFSEATGPIIDNIVELGAALQEGLVNSLGGFGEQMGILLSGAGSVGQAAVAMLTPLIGVVEQVGDMAIKTGLAMIALKKTLSFGNPFAAIAAGVALKALAGVVKSKLSSAIPALAEGGLAYGPTLALVGDNRGASADPEVIAPLSKLSNILRSVVKPMATPQLSMAGYGDVSAATQIQFGELKMRGPDLYASWELQQKKKNRIR